MIALLLALAHGADLHACDNVYSVPGTPRYQIAMDARESSAQLFGAAGFAEDVLFPGMVAAKAKSDGGKYGLGGLRAIEMFGGLHVPSLEQPWGCPYGSSIRDFDMYASAFGAGGGVGPVSFFVSTGATAMISWNQTYLRNVGIFSMPMVMGMAAVAAPVWIAVDDPVMWQNNPQGIFVDVIAGGQFDGGPAGVVSVGWSGTEGPYANYTHPKAHAEASVAVNRDFTKIPYGLLGIRGLPLPGNGMAGRTSLFGRQFGYQTGLNLGEGLQVTSRTVHVEQLDLFKGIFDLRLAALVGAQTQLNEARIGIGKTVIEDGVELGSTKLLIGVFNEPDHWYWGIEGGMRPSVVFRYRMVLDGLKMSGVIGWNEPELLRIYPYAIDNFSVQIQAHFGEGA